MIRTADLLSIARSGVEASNQLLSTTGNNIANVNTEGYVRERTNFVAELTGGVGQFTTERVMNTFAQNQLRRDTTNLAEHEAYWSKTAVLDNVFASEANSISSSMSRFFASLQTANDDPTNMSARQLVLGDAESMLGQMGTLSTFLAEKEREVNFEFEASLNKVNSLVESIASFNESIRIAQANNRHDEPGALMNQRDNAVLELSSLVSIETRNSSNNDGSIMINLTSGESLVMQDGTFSVFEVNNSADLNYKSLQLTSNGKPTSLNLAETELGGTIGGLFRYRDEVLEPSRRELGQIALAVTEAVNTQNRAGMDYDQQLGGEIFTRPITTALNYPGNADSTSIVNGRISKGGASEITSADYRVTIDGVTAGVPPTVDVTVELLNLDGSAVTDVNGAAITQNYTGLTAQSGEYNEIFGGIELEFSKGTGYTVGDQFLLQPTKDVADKIEVFTTRPEDLALASPIRIEAGEDNLGGSELVSTTVTNTFVDTAPFDSRSSGFDGAGGIHAPGAAPGGGVGAPAAVRFNSATEYEVLDSAGTVITTVSGISSMDNLLEQASGTPGWPAAFSALDNYPGYDFTLQGEPKAGDTFSISFNQNGLNDNRNGLIMANLQNENGMQLNNAGSGDPVSFHEAYANIVGDIGQKAANADIAVKAGEALKLQSKDWYDSVSGVSLDEEAANLVRFQQSYAASARLLNTAQEMFDTILSMVR
ncbi:flagellar hook-associated protein FlgK [Paraglaciecola sp. T6c]|uniref:FlgK family flagellar hook-associated protein n=1 Tax=Pseudoalteromonas atlantica (strain T6c / ATCC BAA-1087) TaxID=3042615 RepID=UPI00005C75B0|nr:flagellar basal body rod C-terminal domain-containing protein [Paraglaciecola sp. T6c]ABG41597.1 flagellar hook-associated protein FlgK [Paraglaciecola sp. T6c]